MFLIIDLSYNFLFGSLGLALSAAHHSDNHAQGEGYNVRHFDFFLGFESKKMISSAWYQMLSFQSKSSPVGILNFRMA